VVPRQFSTSTVRGVFIGTPTQNLYFPGGVGGHGEDGAGGPGQGAHINVSAENVTMHGATDRGEC
jgi:hypothetical protein